MILNTPAQILQAYLTRGSGALFTVYDAGLPWPLYVGSMPDGEGVLDDIGAIYDTPGVKLGRLLASGQNLQSYGLQIKTRSLKYNDGVNKLTATAKLLETVSREVVVVGSGSGANSYKIDTISQTSPVHSTGQDERRRSYTVLNVLLMLIESDNGT